MCNLLFFAQKPDSEHGFEFFIDFYIDYSSNSILCIKHGMNGFMCEAAIDKTRRRRSAGAERNVLNFLKINNKNLRVSVN